MARSGSAPTKPKKLTVAQVAELARRQGLADWDALSPAKQQELVDLLNGEPDEAARHKAAMAAFDRNMEILGFRPAKKKRRR